MSAQRKAPVSPPVLTVIQSANDSLQVQTLAERIERLQAEAKHLAREQVAALEAKLVEAAALADEIARGGEAYPVLLTPRDTAGEKEIEVFRGAGESVEPLGLTALEAVMPTPIDPEALDAALTELAAMAAGKRPVSPAHLEAVIGRVLPAFRHMSGEARLDDRI